MYEPARDVIQTLCDLGYLNADSPESWLADLQEQGVTPTHWTQFAEIYSTSDFDSLREMEDAYEVFVEEREGGDEMWDSPDVQHEAEAAVEDAFGDFVSDLDTDSKLSLMQTEV